MFWFISSCNISGYNPNLVNNMLVLCKIRGYVTQCFSMFYRWMMVMGCIDRYLTSSSSTLLRSYANRRLAYRIILLNLIIWLVLPIYNIIYLDIQGVFCGFSSEIVSIFDSIFLVLLGSLFPSLLMIMSGILTGHNLASKRHRREQNLEQNNNDEIIQLNNARDRQVLFTISIQICLYIISTISRTIILL